MISKKASISVIAKAAGVSSATVSRVLNHPEAVKADTLCKVREIMQQFGYTSDELPTSGKPNGSLILVCLPSIANPFYSNILKGIKASANAHSFHILIHPEVISRSTIGRFNHIRQFANIGGIITLSAKIDLSLLETLDRYAPVVQCCEYNNKSHIPYVSIDDFNAARSVTNYLLSSGRRKIAFINGPLTFNYAQERLRGFETALVKHKVTVPQNWRISLPDISYDIGYSSICQLLSSSNRPNAIFASSDVFAISALRAARRFGLRVPQDLSIIGFDNIDIAAMVSPAISTINQPCFQIGFTACETLAERINNPDSIPRAILLDAERVLRESSPIVDKNVDTYSTIL